MATEDILAGVWRIEERWKEERDRWKQREASLQDFLDALTDRHVRVTQAMIDAIDNLSGEVADQRQQIQANTRAILRLLDDRFGPEPPRG